MKNRKYLLYIDILGFSEMVKNSYQKVKKLFKRIDELNVHRHGAFHTIVFSDTILIFNKDTPVTQEHHEYIVMFACEFVQDLMFRCIDLEIQFRAILTYGEFNYRPMKYIEAYYGSALIEAYRKEKEVKALGLFIDKRILQYNKIFPTVPFDKHLKFVLILQTMQRLKSYGSLSATISTEFIENMYEFVYLKQEVAILKNIKLNIDNQVDSEIRGKYLQTYHLYKLEYKEIIDFFERHDFDYKSVSPDADWTIIKQHFY